MPAISRIFLGWDRPLLTSAIDALWARYASGPLWDMRKVAVVLPTRRASRRLGVRLGEYASASGLRLRPPKMITVGSLPEMLYQPQAELASDLQQTLAWTKVLVSASETALRPLMPSLPPREPIGPWVEMAATLRRLCEDLAADAITPGDVVEQVRGEGEQARWKLIAALYRRYLTTLQQTALADPQHQRYLAVEENRCHSDHDLVLVGCVDLGLRTCQMLEAVADKTSLWIGAPQDQAKLFDGCGRVVPAEWREAHVPIADEDLIPAEDAEHQAALAAQWVTRWRDELGGTAITVGVTDEAFAPLVETELGLCGLATHRAAGLPIGQTAPGRMLELIAEVVARPTWLALSGLLRHSNVLSVFAAEIPTSTVLTQLDHLRGSHFPVRLEDPLPMVTAEREDLRAVLEVKRRVLEWLGPLMRPAQPLSAWCVTLRRIVAQVYGSPLLEMPPDVADQQREAIVEIDAMLQRLSQLSHRLDVTVSAHAAVDMLLQRLADPRSSVTTPPAPIEIAGWLDLTLDDAPALVVVGLNHPFVPQAVTADPFLPGTLRSRLRVADNERRFARDAYVLQVVQQTRAAKALIVGRFGPDGSPTPPSRLLSACPSAITLRRVRRLLENPPLGTGLPTRWHRSEAETILPVPQADSNRTLRSISVTAFRDYLTCPYRFYLRHVMGLRTLDDAASELAANQFGDLVHAAVEAYGQSDDRELADLDRITERLVHHLQTYAERSYGKHPSAAVRVQIAQAEKRLLIVAERQWQRMQSGWRIHAAEAAVTESHGAGIALPDGRQLILKGRVDRIDYHPGSGRWAILDYKTHGHKPMDKHYDKASQTWIDLQLPLYLKMLAALGIDAEFERVDVGYFNISGKAEETGIHLAEFTPELLRGAFAMAEEVARGVLDAAFAPNPSAADLPYDDYAAILQTGIAQNLLTDAEE